MLCLDGGELREMPLKKKKKKTKTKRRRRRRREDRRVRGGRVGTAKNKSNDIEQ
jgi:hypothetical protein